MSRSYGSGAIDKRGAKRWRIRYRVNGKTYSKTVEGSKADAGKALREALGAADKGAHVDPSRMTVGQWLATWLGTVRTEVAPKSHERYSEIVNNFLSPALGDVRLAKLTTPHIQEFYTKWATSGRLDGKTGGLSPRTRRHIHRILKSALSRAVEQQLLVRNPADAFKKHLPKVERKKMVTLDARQATRLLASIRHTRVYWPALLALATGMRRGEILALRWKNIDLDRGVVRVVESLEQTRDGGLRFKAPKTDKARAITLPAFATDELRRLKRRQVEELLSLGIRQTDETPACARADGAPQQPRSLTHEFTRLVGRVKDIPRVRFHDLRHSHATQLLADGIHPKVAQERLGHSTISTTLDLYSHVTGTMQEDAAARLDAALGDAIRGASAAE